MTLVPPVVTAPGVTRWNNPRRWALRTRRFARSLDDPGQESAWATIQAKYAGTAIPSGVPFQPQLARAGYTALEDFGFNTPIPCTVNELVVEAHLNTNQAREVLAALGARSC